MLNIDNYCFTIGSQNEVLNDVLIITPASRPARFFWISKTLGEKTNSETWLCLLNKIRTFYQQNPDVE